MVELDGVQYSIKTPAENTSDMLNRINTYCANNNVKNSKGEQVYVEANYASPLYLLLWAFGYFVTVIQNLIYGLGKAMNVQASSEKQLLNIASMSGVKRGTPSFTTFSAMVRAAIESDGSTVYNPDVNSGKCIITSEDIITYDGVVYTPALYPQIVLEPGESAFLTFVATSYGSYQIAESSIQGFDSNPANLATFVQYTAIPGQAQESISSLRERVQRRQYSGTSLDAAMDAIRELEGITTCNIYYNESINADRPIGEDNIIIPPRTAAVIVQGYNKDIAKKFYEHLFCPTITKENVGGSYDERLLEVQTYVSHANQEIPLIVLKPAQDEIFVNVHIAQSVEGSIEQGMKEAVCSVANGLTIGQTVTSSMILDALKDYSSYGVVGVQMRGGKTSALSFRAIPYEDAIFTFNVNNITIVMPEADN